MDTGYRITSPIVVRRLPSGQWQGRGLYRTPDNTLEQTFQETLTVDESSDLDEPEALNALNERLRQKALHLRPSSASRLAPLTSDQRREIAAIDAGIAAMYAAPTGCTDDEVDTIVADAEDRSYFD